jgi:nickel-type superoxide dismutase maturation protease
LVLVLLVALRRRVRHVVVTGASMWPTLAPGDRLVTLHVPGHPRVGGLALTPDPRAPERMLIKRVQAVDGDGVHLRGDAALGSTDSRTFGPVALDAVEACVAFRYHPPERAGRVSWSRVPADPPECLRPAP